ncbi:hypothetical protein LTR84_008182 [Exophiala bonariae]|uniref:N-acetyltransferase domain-containing protein n=1 Tax=Exophiala bonariae TaxID=1690606 RepID=A0AAV9N0F9_9EURO|nr:hypothetical protein LTR84_008182 [Exophiala bonariae]
MQSPPYITRPAQATDLSALPAVEDSAGTLFRTIEGLETLADDEPLSVPRLQEILDVGKIWVAVRVEEEGTGTYEKESTETIVGFLAAFPLLHHLSPPSLPPQLPSTTTSQIQSQSRFLHVAELSIHAAHHRRGLGRRLMGDLIRYAEQVNNVTGPPSSIPQARVDALTLTTYRDVPFNGLFYAKMGFRISAADKILSVFGDGAKHIWDEEQMSIPRREERVWMARWMGGRKGLSGERLGEK